MQLEIALDHQQVHQSIILIESSPKITDLFREKINKILGLAHKMQEKLAHYYEY